MVKAVQSSLLSTPVTGGWRPIVSVVSFTCDLTALAGGYLVFINLSFPLIFVNKNSPCFLIFRHCVFRLHRGACPPQHCL